jgi:predicted site-specific integrase-resolvase
MAAIVREVLTPGEVARMFGVDPKTVVRWVKAGRFPPGSHFFTPGGQHRFYADEMVKLRDRRPE